MFINQLLSAVFFRLFNFAIIVCLGIYLFKKYARPFLYSLMSQKDAEKDSLLHQRLKLEHHQKEIDHLIKKDFLLCEGLKSKIHTWNEAVAQDYEQREKNYSVRKLAYQEKKKTKAVAKREQKAQELIAQGVVQELNSSLSDYFQTDDAGKEYLDSIILMLKERE